MNVLTPFILKESQWLFYTFSKLRTLLYSIAEISVHKLETTGQAQSAPTPFTTYGFFYDGEFVTNEIFSAAKFEKFLDQHGVSFG